MDTHTPGRRAEVYRRRLVVGTLAAVLIGLFAGIIFAGASTWYAYNQTFGARSAAKGWLQREGASYSVDVYDELLAVRRLEIYCLRFSAGLISKDEFNLLRRQADSTIEHFAPGTVLGKAAAAHESYPIAYESVRAFLQAAKQLENGAVSIAQANLAGEEAAKSWSALTVASTTAEFAARDLMSQAIADFRPLAVRAFVIGSILLALLAAASIVAAYAAWRAWQAERRRFDRFEVLLATVGHDLRSPLQALVGAAKLAAADTVSSEREKFVHIVHERSAFFTRLLDDLVNLARSESLSFVPAPVDLAAWFEAATVRYRQAAEAKNLVFEARLSTQRQFILFDSHRLTQCADNLVSNAVRYTDHGHVRFTVRCDPSAAAGNDGTLTIEVSDTGRGIAASDKRRIFQPFVRVETGVKGMGIGLSMVASLASRLGGSVSVQSELRHGSTFTFSVPIVEAPPPASAPADSAAASLLHSRSHQPASVPRVLVVDDDPHITQVVGGLLPHMGFAADVAIGGRKGLELAEQGGYCAVLTDLQMPEVDGFDLAKALRAKAKPCPMLIAMTAYTTKPAADHRSAVFDAMLRKPFKDEELVDLLDRAATRWADLTSSTRQPSLTE